MADSCEGPFKFEVHLPRYGSPARLVSAGVDGRYESVFEVVDVVAPVPLPAVFVEVDDDGFGGVGVDRDYAAVEDLVPVLELEAETDEGGVHVGGGPRPALLGDVLGYVGRVDGLGLGEGGDVGSDVVLVEFVVEGGVDFLRRASWRGAKRRVRITRVQPFLQKLVLTFLDNSLPLLFLVEINL